MRRRRSGRPEHPGAGRRSSAGLRGWLLTASLLTVVLPLAACTGTPPSAAAVAELIRSSTGAIPTDDEQAIRTIIDRLNNTAGGAVPDQQGALAAVVEPGSAGALDDCRAATTTLRFLPVYSALRPSPEWTPRKGGLTGTVYALPTLIRIYTGERVTATDLTTLHLGVVAGEAFLTPLCVS